MKNTFKLHKRHTDKPKHAYSLAKSKSESKGLRLNILEREMNWEGVGEDCL